MAVSQEFVWKPSSSGLNRGALTVVLPAAVQGAKVSILDKSGNVLDSSADYSIANMGRAHYRFTKPGSAYPSGSTLRVTNPDGTTKDVKIANPASYIKTVGLPDAVEGPVGEAFQSSGGTGATGSASGYESSVSESPGGISYVTPGAPDFSQVESPYVDFPGALSRARQLGAENKASYFGNITSPQTKAAALGLVQTDVEGIKQAADVLAPYARAQGEQDLTTNIARASRIDQANLARIPGFNKFNMAQASAANKFNQAQQTEAVSAAGMDYRNRMDKILNQLSTMSEGRLIGSMDEQLTREMQNRGADMTAASGISSISGAGVRAQDRLNIMERLGIQQYAQTTLPGILQQAQNTLQAQTERLPTLYGSPTQIPLQTSNIEARLPVTSGISAGQAQFQMGTAATEIETVDAENAFARDLATQQFNESAKYNRDMSVLGEQKDYMGSVDKATQNMLNADYQQAKLDQERAAKEQQGIFSSLAPVIKGALEGYNETGTFGGAVSGAIDGVFGGGSKPTGGAGGATGTTGGATSGGTAGGATSGGGGGSGGTMPTGRVTVQTPSGPKDVIMDDWGTITNNGGYTGAGIPKPSGQAPSGGGNAPRSKGNNVSRAIDGFINSIANNVFGSGMSKKTPQDAEDAGFDLKPATRPKDELTVKEDLNEPVNMGNVSASADQVGDMLNSANGVYTGDISDAPEGEVDKSTVLEQLSSPAENAEADYKTVAATAEDLDNWNTYTASNKVAKSGNNGADIVANKGIITQQEAAAIKSVNNAVATVIDPNATDTQKIVAIAQATASASLSSPLDKANAAAGLGALNTLFSKNASDDQKALALSQIGVNAADANEIISEVNAGNANAAFSIFNTSQNWDQMTTLQKAINITQVASDVMNATSNLLANKAGESALTFIGESAGGASSSMSSAASTFSDVAGTAAAVYGIYKGIDTAVTTTKLLDDMPRSSAVWKGIKNQTIAGAEVGAGIGFLGWGPLGSGIGAVVGAQIGSVMGAIQGVTGTGKNAAQIQRDAWRKNLEKMGVAKKNPEGYHEVSLADGSKYNIGVEKAKTLTNLDGSKRSTYDVDWGNGLQVEAIPYAHLMNIAAGTDPKTNTKFDTFHRTTAQLINAATSNAKTLEDVKSNFRTMASDGKIDPRDLALRIEFLRADDKISNQEYGVYINSLNDMFGSKIVPVSKQEFIRSYETKYGTDKRRAA